MKTRNWKVVFSFTGVLMIFLTVSCTPLQGDIHPAALMETGYVLSSSAVQTQPAIRTPSPRPIQSHKLTPAVVPATNTLTPEPPTETTTLTPMLILSSIETACMEPRVELPAAGEISGRLYFSTYGPHNGNQRDYALVVFYPGLRQKFVPDPFLPKLLDTYWLNNQWLALSKPDLEHWIHTTIFINPVTGEQQEFHSNYKTKDDRS